MGVVFWDCLSSLCPVVYCAGRTFSQDELTLRLKQSCCISRALSERGRALWQLLFAARFSSADSRGAAEWASAGLVLINDANTDRGAMPEQTGLMSALATDGRAPFPVLHGLLQRSELVNEEQ